MVYLTILGRFCLIQELDVILSEWQQCSKKINSFNAEISKLQNREEEIDIGKNMKFQEFRCKRNNLASKYYGYEHILKDYLKTGRAHNLKEALEVLENDLHKQEMLNAQQKVSEKITNISAQLSNQSAQIADLQKEIQYLTD